MRHLLVVAVAAGLLSGCSFLRDRSLDYVHAEPGAPLVVPEGVNTRPIKPLYPIPPQRPNDARITEPVKPPFPPSMEQVAVAELPALPNSPGRSPVKLGTDGNGVPELRVVGPRERVWDELGRALANAGVIIKDRNQSLGIVDVSIDNEAYQVRMARATEAFVINVQKDENTVAPVRVSRALLPALQARWP